MVRVNLIDPRCLADQHLVAEYDEILMLLGYVRRYPDPVNIPREYVLGAGHIRFFKDKLVYLKKRHDLLREEMACRGFVANHKVDLRGFPKALHHGYVPTKEAVALIKERIEFKLRKKPWFYRYYGRHRPLAFFLGLLRDAKSSG